MLGIGENTDGPDQHPWSHGAPLLQTVLSYVIGQALHITRYQEDTKESQMTWWSWCLFTFYLPKDKFWAYAKVTSISAENNPSADYVIF